MPKSYPLEIKNKAIKFRKLGFSYSEIPRLVNYPIAKNTFTGWFKGMVLSEDAKIRITARIREGGAPGRRKAQENTQKRRRDLVKNTYKQVDSEVKTIDKITAKLCLAMLYLGEGKKGGELFRFGNSGPKIIKLFLRLLRGNFSIDEERLRGKVQCRADQDVKQLEKFWSDVSAIPISQFMKAQIDKRTIGKPTKKIDYRDVFVIEYYSKALFLEVKFLSDIICKRLKLGL